MPEGIVLQLPTVDPLIAAQSPKFSGTKIGITSRLASVSDNQIRISFEVENLTQSAVTLAFLTSDIVVSDDLGNVFPQQWDTQPIRDELDSSGYSNSKEYTLNLAGSLHPMAKIINVSYPSLSEGEQPFQIAIPLVSVEMVSAGFEAELTDNGGNAMDLKFKFTNNSPYLFVLRLNSSDFLVTDDLGNAYQINEYYSHQALAIALDGANQYSNNQEYQWEYTPGLNPKATLLNIQINLMGQPLSVQIPLSISTEKIRYEAKVLYAYPDSHQFAIGVTVFNLGDADFVLRLDGNQTYITQDGVTFTAQVDNERIGGIIRPGSSTGFQLRFDGNLGNQSNLFLILPLVSGIENIQIPVMPEN
jgi:hypothetical protein